MVRDHGGRTATRNSFGPTPAIKTQNPDRDAEAVCANVACAAIKQSFADCDVTPAQRHRAYKCAALRGAERGSGELMLAPIVM